MSSDRDYQPCLGGTGLDKKEGEAEYDPAIFEGLFKLYLCSHQHGSVQALTHGLARVGSKISILKGVLATAMSGLR
jgi:hypothetical protein